MYLQGIGDRLLAGCGSLYERKVSRGRFAKAREEYSPNTGIAAILVQQLRGQLRASCALLRGARTHDSDVLLHPACLLRQFQLLGLQLCHALSLGLRLVGSIPAR